MKKKMMLLLACLLSVWVVNAKNALVVISHGSPMEEWRRPVLDLEPLLRQKVKQMGLDAELYVRVAMMEFTEPTIASVVENCEKQGCDTVFAIPLFIAPSGHSDEDIPNIIGHKFNIETINELKEEGTRFVKSKLPIILGPTLSYDDILEEIMVKDVKAMSSVPKDEALLVISHGDKQWHSFWDKKMKSICDTCMASTGIQTGTYKFVAMGYKMATEMLPVIKDFAKTKKRILIQGVYLTSTAKELADAMGIGEVIKEQLGRSDVEIVFSDQGILPSSTDTILEWILERTQEWIRK